MKTQNYPYTTVHRPTIRYAIICITTFDTHPPSNSLHLFFTFLANNEDVLFAILSFLGEEEVVAYCVAKQTLYFRIKKTRYYLPTNLQDDTRL